MKTLHLSIMIIVSVLIIVASSDWAHAQLPSGNLALRLISISKSNFTDGGIIPIRGHTFPNSTVNISLSDNLGNLENSTQVISNNTGYFYTNLGIPSHVIGGGSWHIFVKSHSDYDSIRIQVNTHGIVTMPDNFPSGLSPLKQFRLGIPTDAIQCHTSFQLVLNAEDGHPACVKHDTAQKLIERGWAKITVTKATFDVIQSNTTQTNAMANLGNDTGITTIGNQAYYFETPNYSHDAYFNSPQISFHDVIFTLFPSGFRGGLPVNGCGGQYYWTDAKFSDGTSELLHIFVGFPQCSDPQPPTYFSTHVNPQAGLTFYNGKMKLLVSNSAINSSGN